MRSAIDLWRGVCKHPWKAAGYIFTAFSVIFTIITGLTYFVPGVSISGPIPLAGVVVVSICYGLKKVWKPSRINIRVGNSNTTVEVIFGDLFVQNGIRVIAVNEFFDSKLGRPVSDMSLHGTFLRKCFGGHPEPFDKQVEDQLKETEWKEVEKVEGKTRRYPIGSSALVIVDQDRYLTFAFSETNPATCKAYTDVTTMWTALHELWARARIESNGHPINVPLVGSGLSGIGLPTRDLLNLIILSAITETKTKEVARTIRIVLHRDRFEELDLRDVEDHWRN